MTCSRRSLGFGANKKFLASCAETGYNPSVVQPCCCVDALLIRAGGREVATPNRCRFLTYQYNIIYGRTYLYYKVNK